MHIIFGLTRLALGLWGGYLLFLKKEKPSTGILYKYPTAAKALAIVLICSGLYSIGMGAGDYERSESD